LRGEQPGLHLAFARQNVGPHQPGELEVVDAGVFAQNFECPKARVGD